MPAKKSPLTKSSLMNEIDLKLQDLNLLKSVLQANTHPKKEELELYAKKFKDLFS